MKRYNQSDFLQLITYLESCWIKSIMRCYLSARSYKFKLHEWDVKFKQPSEKKSRQTDLHMSSHRRPHGNLPDRCTRSCHGCWDNCHYSLPCWHDIRQCLKTAMLHIPSRTKYIGHYMLFFAKYSRSFCTPLLVKTYTPHTWRLTHHTHEDLHTTHMKTFTPHTWRLTHHTHEDLHTTCMKTYTPHTWRLTHHTHEDLHTTCMKTYTPHAWRLTHHTHEDLHTTHMKTYTPHAWRLTYHTHDAIPI